MWERFYNFSFDVVFPDWKITPELHITVLLTGMFPEIANWKWIWTMLSHKCFVIALSWVENYEISQIYQKTSFAKFWPHVLK